MQDQPGSRTTAASWSAVRNELRDEFLGPPRLGKRALFSVIGFGLLLVASLVIPVLWDVEPMPGFALVAAGMMMLLGFAELLDASNRWFVTVVRVGGLVIALLGFAIQMA